MSGEKPLSIVIAVDSFKGSLTTLEAADSIKQGVLRAAPNARVLVIPVADGGEGTAEAFTRGLDGELREVEVEGPLGLPVKAALGLLPDGTAVLDMASAAGLTLMAGSREVLKASSYGVGQLIIAALDLRPKTLYIGLGGSATNDGGAGCAQALGAVLRDGDGRDIERGAKALAALHSIDISNLDKRLANTDIVLLCDVDNPLLGENGATAIFGPQKGVTASIAPLLEEAMQRYAGLMEQATGRARRNAAGAGAAGGLGFCLMSLTNARMRPGIDALLDVAGFEGLLNDCDLVITGEGRIDGQTARGKAPVGVARRAKQKGVPVIAIGGGIADDVSALYSQGITAVASVTPRPMPLDEAINSAPRLLADAAERAMRLVLLGRCL